MDDALGVVPAIERGEALADARAAADTFRQQRQALQRAGDVPLAHGRRHVHQAGVEQERLGLAEMVEHTVDEADEHAGVEAHGARRVEQHHQPQRLSLLLAPHELDRHAAVADVAADGTAQVDAAALQARALAAGEARAHGAGEAGGQCVRLGNGVGVGELAEVGLGQPLGARGAFHAAAGVALGGRIASLARHLVAEAGAFLAVGLRAGDLAHLRRRCRLGRGADMHHTRAAAPEPIGVEHVVELVPVGPARAEQHLERGPQGGGPPLPRPTPECAPRPRSPRGPRRSRCRAACA